MQSIGRAIRRAIAFAASVPNNFTVISNNFWGGHIYERLGRKYRTPFVGTFVPTDDYLSLLERFHEVIHNPLRCVKQTRYPCLAARNVGDNWHPIATLADGIEIHFRREVGPATAQHKWESRLGHMSGNLFVKLCDHEGLTQQQVDRFEALPFRKVCFVGSDKLKGPSVVHIPGLGDRCPDGLVLSQHSWRYFDALAWVSGQSPSPTWRTKITRV